MMAPEGRVPVLVLATGALSVNWLAGTLWALPLAALFFMALVVFRERSRQVPPLPLAVVSPVDGCVVSTRVTRDPWLEREVQRVGLRPRWPGILALRSPTEGKVMEYRLDHDAYRHAQFCVTPRRTAVCHALWLRTDEDDDVIVVVSSRWRFHHTRFHVQVGERVGQGQRCGFLWLSNRVDVLVPRSSRLEAAKDQVVQGGANVVATLVHD